VLSQITHSTTKITGGLTKETFSVYPMSFFSNKALQEPGEMAENPNN
jgi:hypothetical protein